MSLAAAALLLAAAATGARAEEGTQAWPGLIVPGGIVVFYDSEGTLSYPSPTPADLPKDAVLIGPVKGKACQFKLDIPFLSSIGTLSGAAGRGGYWNALVQLRKNDPGIRGVFDVKVDDHSISVLGFFERLCTEVTAYGFR